MTKDKKEFLRKVAFEKVEEFEQRSDKDIHSDTFEYAWISSKIETLHKTEILSEAERKELHERMNKSYLGE